MKFSGVEILHHGSAGYDRWLELWRRWPRREVWAHPDYVALFAEAGQRVACVALDRGEAGVLFPLILRPLAALDWAAGVDLWDATSAYGYGGPFCWGDPSAADAQRFWDGYQAWAAEARLVSTFARLSLFPEQLLSTPFEVEARSTNVVRSLDLDEDALWYDYAHKVRKNVKRARAEGLSVEVDDTGRRLDAFLAIYLDTMDRNQAGRGYYFPRTFFEKIVDGLRGQYVFFHVLQDGCVVSTELVLESEAHLYSFLGGTSQAHFASRPNDLLKHEVALWGRARGKRAYVLGGGYRGEDGIFQYKRTFAPLGVVPFSTASAVHRAADYAMLMERRHAWEADRGVAWAPAANYFPGYRA